ncbi:MAG: adenylyltransferase/cytidyltransferase family protein [Ilumatobacteraceae bacterium]
MSSAPQSIGSKHPTGLIVGRFNPPHLGHSYMIEWAAARVDRLVVFVNTRDGELVPGTLRAAWLADLHRDVTVIEVHHDLGTDFDDEALWAQWMALFRSRWPHVDGPHAVFSSDPYVTGIADRFGAEPVVVDADRVAVPISATQIRHAPADHLDRLAPPVRDWVEANLL